MVGEGGLLSLVLNSMKKATSSANYNRRILAMSINVLKVLEERGLLECVAIRTAQ